MIPVSTNKAAAASKKLYFKNISSNTVVKVGKTLKIRYGTSKKYKNKKIGFRSSNKKVATVSKKGVIRGKKKGTVKITIYIKKKKLQYNIFADIATIIIPLFHFFGRIGCFLVGCCFGVESHIGFTFENSPLEVANHVHRFPIQLVEATYNLCLFIILYNLLKRSKLKGKLLGLYLILYPVGRFIFEFFRGDEYRGFLFGLSTSQIISIILLFIGIYILTKKEKNSSSK